MDQKSARNTVSDYVENYAEMSNVAKLNKFRNFWGDGESLSCYRSFKESIRNSKHPSWSRGYYNSPGSVYLAFACSAFRCLQDEMTASTG